ncbi:MAG TPA: hypothetical protein VD963_03780 [Phycisphaerales bacterium]|nr:hypothetical protein [Phycisphaerales bacterium]
MISPVGQLVLRLGASALLIALGAGVHGAGAGTVPQPPPDTRAPDPGTQTEEPASFESLGEPVRRALAAPYLTAEEAKDLRIFHGVWRRGDLDTPARTARAALMCLALDDPSLVSPHADVLDRAEAALLRGEAQTALELLAGNRTPRARRVAAQALMALGRHAEARAAAHELFTAVRADAGAAPADIVDAVRARALTMRLSAPGEDQAAIYHQMLALLGEARSRLSRTYWPAYLAEAELLVEKDNPAGAEEALRQALPLNPSSARAAAMLGELAVASFNLGPAAKAAEHLDQLATLGAEQVEGEPVPLSTAGAMIRARAALRQGDADQAASLMDAVLAHFPAHREALALRAAAQALRYDNPGTERLLAHYQTVAPGAPDALFEVGRTLAEARQYQPASEHLTRAREALPGWAAPAIELGLLHMQSGEDAQAVAALRDAAALDPFNVRARNSLALAEQLAGYLRLESDHFIVRYAPGRDGAPPPDAVLAREMLGPLEENHRLVTGTGPGGLRYEPDRKTIIDLLPDHRAFGVRIAGLPRIHTIAAATGPVIAMESPRQGPNHLGTYDWVRVLRHEYTHTVTLDRTGNRIPHWFTEAAAVYLEQAPRDWTTCQLLAGALRAGELFDLDEINIAFVRPRRPTDRAQAYAQGHWMYQYLVETWGPEAPLSLMDQYAQGVREEAAFAAVLGISRAQFLERFTEWARAQAVAWGLAQGPGEPSLPEILASEPGRSESVEKLSLAQATALLERHPAHPDLLEVAIGAWLREHAGSPGPGLVPLLERYAQARPVDPMPHRTLATLHLAGEVGTPADAIPHLRWLDERETKSPTYAAELARQHAALAAGDPADAAAQWASAAAAAERATQIAPFDADHRELAARIAIARSDHQTARRHLRALVEIEPDREIHRARLEAFEARVGAAPAPADPDR